MSNRIALGRRRSSSGDRGLMISGLSTSQTGRNGSSAPYNRADVTAVDSNNKGNQPHNFDSQEHVGGGMHVFYYGQGTLTAGATAYISHAWGTTNSTATADRPLYAVRWSYSTDLTNGVAVRTRTPGSYFATETSSGSGFDDEPGFGGGGSTTYKVFEGLITEHTSKDQIKLTSRMIGDNNQGANNHNGHTIYYAILVFHEDDYNGGRSI
jgi:hypothetical protein|tara:strand:+ start:1707 stop:2336 length:630 start_codon:yes stop_codon:yes gene_type:complete